jgi:murein DD-endopeptidase MepM/ murein hydrolase activator NlpD
MDLYHLIGLSGQKYLCPIKPRPGEKPRFWRDSPEHKGKYAHARDIIIPDPRVKVLPVYAPASGKIARLVQHNTLWGEGEQFLPHLNYITVVTDVPGEFYEICHIGALSCQYKIGDRITIGEQIATTGTNGRMTDPRHLHMMVAKVASKGFTSVRIRWQRAAVYK